jgi:hypothetical protein
VTVINPIKKFYLVVEIKNLGSNVPPDHIWKQFIFSELLKSILIMFLSTVLKCSCEY